MTNRRSHLISVILILPLLLIVLSPHLSQGQGASLVIEVGPNLMQNTITAIQSVLQVANQILELTPLDDILVTEGFLEDLEAIRDVMGDLRGLGWDVRSLDGQLTRLFGIDALPGTSSGMADWHREVRTINLEARQDAARVQTLLRTLRRTVDHLLGLMRTIASAIGNLAISQTISQTQQKVAQLLSEQQLTRVVHERAETIEGATDVAETEILNKINCGIWKSWPGMACE